MRAVRLLIWVAGAALCGAMLVGSTRNYALSALDGSVFAYPRDRAWISYGIAPVIIALGLVVWARRPDSRTGMLMVALAFPALLSDPIIFTGSRLLMTVGLALTWLNLAITAQLLLSYPTGRLTSRLDRGFVAVAYAWVVAYDLMLLLFYDPRAPHDPYIWECASCALPLTNVAWHDVTGARHVLNVILIGLSVVLAALLVRKIVRAAPVARSVALPLTIVACLGIARFALLIATWGVGSGGGFVSSSVWFWSGIALDVAIPAVLAAGMLWGGAGRAAVADLLVELERTPPGAVQGALARALGDPSLELGLWLPERSAYVDAQGQPIDLPAPGSARAVTVLGPADAPIAALVHDPALLERPALLGAAGAAARLALENERLQAELRLQLEEVRASRARIVQAGDDERRRLERDLHDGAQQRLLGLGLALQLVRQQLGAGGNGTQEVLADAEAELRAALDELRELAHGIHPAILTDQGLGPALSSLADRSPVPVTIVAVPSERLGEQLEAAAYFLVSESLANVAKYACASAVSVTVTRRNGSAVVEVEDDGVGGADPGRGSGLRGLLDRVQALDGTLAIDSPPGGGTRIHAEIPCGS